MSAHPHLTSTELWMVVEWLEDELNAERGIRALEQAKFQTQVELLQRHHRNELGSERLDRIAAQRGLVANYEQAAILEKELRKAKLAKWARRMWDLGLYRKVAYDPDKDPQLSIVSPHHPAHLLNGR